MSKRHKSANRNQPLASHGDDADDEYRRLWSEDEEEVSGRSWSLILIFIAVPLVAIAGLALCVSALFAYIFGAPPA